MDEYRSSKPPEPQESERRRHTRAETRTALGAFVFSLVTFQGLTINLMPLLFGTVADTFGVNLRQQGQLQSFFLAGGILGLVVSGYVTERIGSRRSGTFAVALIGLGSFMLGLAAEYSQVLAAATVIGIGNMWILAAYSAVVARNFQDVRQRMFMFAMAVFAASATAGSMMFGYLIELVSDWRTIFVVSALIPVAWLAFFTFFARRKLLILDRSTVTQQQDSREDGLTLKDRLLRTIHFLGDGLFNRGAFWLLAVIVLLDIVAAGNIVAWTARYFQTEYGVGSDQAGMVLAASAAGVFVGRVLMGAFVSGRVGDRPLLGICYAAGILVYVLILIIPGYTIGLILVFFNGVFIAAQAPTMYAITSAKFAKRAGTAIPLIDAIGICGGFSTPALVGALGDHFGLGTVLWFIPVLGVILVAIVFAWEIVDKANVRQKENHQSGTSRLFAKGYDA